MRVHDGVTSASLGQADRLVIRGALRQCAFARANAPLFYSVGAACLLETTAGRGAEIAQDDPAFLGWLRSDWLTERHARALKLREYIAVTWPEFDWPGAVQEFSARTPANGADGGSLTEKALAQCVATAQSAIFYRFLSRWTDDPQLRRIASIMSRLDQAAFARFRERFERCSREQPLGFRAQWRTIQDAVRAARDVRVQGAFEVLKAEWGPNAPFAQLVYPEFVRRLRAVFGVHADVRWHERCLFGAWTRDPVAAPQRLRLQRWFKPVVSPDAAANAVHTAPRWRG